MVNKLHTAGLFFAVAALLGQQPTGQVPFYKDRQNLLVYIDDSGNSHPVGTAGEWEIRRSHIIHSLQLVMGPLPEPEASSLDLQIEATEELPGIRRQKITFRSAGEDRVSAFLLTPRGLRRGIKVPGILCLHQTTSIGKAEPAGLGGKPNLHYALELAERGYVTLAPDYPNFGDYKFDSYAHGFASATMKGIFNHRRAIDLLQSLPEVDPDRIAVIGHSLGGHNALFVAAFDPRIKAVVTSCGFTSFAKYKGGNLAGWSHKGYMPRIAEIYGNDPARMPFDFTELLAYLAPRPVFINAPVGDDNFAVSGVRDCVAAADVVYQKVYHAGRNLQVIYPPGGHDFPPQARETAYKFLARSLHFRSGAKPVRIR
jgi:dienelactone hydrolase